MNHIVEEHSTIGLYANTRCRSQINIFSGFLTSENRTTLYKGQNSCCPNVSSIDCTVHVFTQDVTLVGDFKSVCHAPLSLLWEHVPCNVILSIEI